jgi:holin (3TMs family)
MALDPFTGALDAAGKVSDLFGKAIDKIWPDPAVAAQAKAVIMGAEGQQAMQQLTAELSPIIAEAQSADKWTSRARPTFLYVMYTMILLAVPMGVLSAFSPTTAQHVADGLGSWLRALPSELWGLFTTGYLGYSVLRGADKHGGLMPLLTGSRK